MKKYCLGDQAIYDAFISIEPICPGKYYFVQDPGLEMEKTYNTTTKKELLQQILEHYTYLKMNQGILDILQDTINDTPEGI